MFLLYFFETGAGLELVAVLPFTLEFWHMCTAVPRRSFLVDLGKHMEQDWVLGGFVFVRLCRSVLSGCSTSFNSLVTHKSPSHSTCASVVGIVGLFII